MSEPLSRAAIRAMPTRERVARVDELRRWAAAGAIDGQPAPPAGPQIRPASHRFTRAELAAMTPEDIIANRPAILAQAARDRGIRDTPLTTSAPAPPAAPPNPAPPPPAIP